MAVRLVGYGSRVVPASLALGSPVLRWPAEVIAPLAMVCIGSIRVLSQAAQRFASSAGYLGQSSSTGSRRGGDNCTAAACEVVLVLTGGWSLAGHRQLVRHREPGTLGAFPWTGVIVLSCPSFLGGPAFLTACRETYGPFLRLARSGILVAPCETIAVDEVFRLDSAFALALPIASITLTGRDC